MNLEDKIKALQEEKSNIIKNRLNILNDVYSMNENFLSDEEKEMLKKTFEKPEMFIVLRKALEIFTLNEIGLLYNARALSDTELEAQRMIIEGVRKLYVETRSAFKAEKNKELKEEEVEIDKELKRLDEELKAKKELELQRKEEKKAEENPFGGNR